MKLLLASTFEILGDKIVSILEEDLSQLSVLCIPTAAYAEDNHQEWLKAEMAQIRSRVQKFEIYDIAGKSREEVEQAVQGFDVIYVTGGNTYYLLEQINHCDLKSVIIEHQKNGGIYFGSSAGAIVTGPLIDFVEEMDDPSKTNLENFEAMNFIDFLFVPHVDHRIFKDKISKILRDLKKEKETVVALNDNQALLVDGNIVKIY